MDKPFKVYFVKDFPIEKLTDKGGDGFLFDPNHIRNRYGFVDAILEHIDNTFCEPVQILIRNEREITAGPSGVTRLHALSTKRGWTHIPAIVSTTIEPEWLDTSIPITSLAQFRSYYRLEPATYGFEEDGRAYHHNQNPNPEQVNETFVVSEATKKRILEMLEIEKGI